MTILQYDLLIESLRTILKDSLHCEDNELKIKNKAKYDLFNLMREIDNKWLKQVEKELEYNEQV